MGLKAFVAHAAAFVIAPSLYRAHKSAVSVQRSLLLSFLEQAKNTSFGVSHQFSHIRSYHDFCSAVSLRDYEDMKDDIALIADGKPDVLWTGLPLYFCKSSGTTSGTKYIPVTRGQIIDMIRAARNALFLYVAETGHAEFFDHKMIFLQGSPELERHGNIPYGRLSGIVYHHVPRWMQSNRLPSYEVNCIEDWEQKVEAIARETLHQRMSVISGIPPWVVMYFEKLQELSGKEFIKDIFPDFKLFAHGGVNFEPYRHRIESLIGESVPTVETYPASEGFIAYQDSQTEQGLMLNINGGIFFEFVRADEIHKENPRRIMLNEVEMGVNYAVILTTNAGLWAYKLGDTIRFVSLNPYRIIVTGRIKHFISAFGEHVIAEEVDFAILHALREHHAGVTEFTVAPEVSPEGELPYHEWLIEFSCEPQNLSAFAATLDNWLQQKNSYYRDLRKGHVLQQLKISILLPNAFNEYMKEQGKLGGQNKVPRLTNDRLLAAQLQRWIKRV